MRDRLIKLLGGYTSADLCAAFTTGRYANACAHARPDGLLPDAPVAPVAPVPPASAPLNKAPRPALRAAIARAMRSKGVYSVAYIAATVYAPEDAVERALLQMRWAGLAFRTATGNWYLTDKGTHYADAALANPTRVAFQGFGGRSAHAVVNS